ncbi:MAG: type III pantothenate kinase [Planctomycetota bacterium]
MVESASEKGVRIIAVSVGNTRVNVAACDGREAGEMRGIGLDDADAAARTIASMAHEHDAQAVVVATVNETFSDALVTALRGASGVGVYRIGVDVGLPNAGGVDPDAKTGQDRLLAALAAFESLQQACVVVDAGTAITVDFVDGEGVFQGGAIAPGLRMSLGALHAHTDALPEVRVEDPGEAYFGKNTEQAMLHGAVYGARGLVRLLTERFAEAYEAYPLIVATGGDAELLFGDDELVDRIVPDLVLRGIALACERSLGDAED